MYCLAPINIRTSKDVAMFRYNNLIKHYAILSLIALVLENCSVKDLKNGLRWRENQFERCIALSI